MAATLRTKLLIGLTPLLAILVGLGIWAIAMFARLGGDIDVILRENYRSVLAAQDMKEALERMDSAALFAIGGRDERARSQYADSRRDFETSLATELGNITLPGEGTRADRIGDLFADYEHGSDRFYSLPPGSAERSALYFDSLLPAFVAIKGEADAILAMNQGNMEQENDRARRSASVATRGMIAAVCVATAFGVAAALLLAKALLAPISALTDASRAMARGDYDQVVPATSGDELGELAQAFNTMARRLREFREAGTVRLVRAQRTAQAAIDAFPDPIVVVDTDGSVERSNPAARRLLGTPVTVESPIPWPLPMALSAPIARVLGGGPDEVPTGVENALILRDDGQEKFYLPRVLAIRGEEGPLGAALALQDVTKFRLVDQLKSDMVSTVSHELKTPLTSMQMAVHLLLEEAVGPLTTKQTELLLAARQDSDRLLAMVNDLLDLTRIEQGRVKLRLAPVHPLDLLREATDRFRARADERGVSLVVEEAGGLPEVDLDRERIDHVFDNLIANALRHTHTGGHVTLGASTDGRDVVFRVDDDGEGIPPQHLPRIFERFYRVPGASEGGAGLGLAISRDIVEAHGGRIEAISEVGRGSTFVVKLPTIPAGDAGPSLRGESSR